EDPREYGEPPEVLPMPELRPYVDDVHIFAPAPEEEADSIEIPRGPNIKPPPEHVPLEESLSARIATVQPDDVSTGDLAPDGAEVGQTWTLPDVRDELANGAEEITVRIEDTGDELTLTHDFAPKEREILLEGGLLHWLQEHGKQVA